MQEEQSVEKARRVASMPLLLPEVASGAALLKHKVTACMFFIPKSYGCLSHHSALYPGTPGTQKLWHPPKLYSIFFRMFAHALPPPELWSLFQPSAQQAVLFLPARGMMPRESLFWEAVWKWEKQ